MLGRPWAHGSFRRVTSGLRPLGIQTHFSPCRPALTGRLDNCDLPQVAPVLPFLLGAGCMVVATFVAAVILPSAKTVNADCEAHSKEQPLTPSEEASDQVEQEEERTTQEVSIVAVLLAIVLANFANGTWAVEPIFLTVRVTRTYTA